MLDIDFRYQPWPATDVELLNATGFETLLDLLLRFHNERSEILKLIAMEHYFLCSQVSSRKTSCVASGP
jgi:hypothetical protein